MGKVKNLFKSKIEESASHYLSDQPEGTLYDAYLKLKEEQENGQGWEHADKFVTVWQPLEHMNVDQIVDIIESGANGTDSFDAPEFIQNKEEKFARENAEIIFQMRIESWSLYENDVMPKEFIEDIVDTPEHAKDIKNLMYATILKDVTENPGEFQKDEIGNFTCDHTMYDYGNVIEDYCQIIYLKEHPELKPKVFKCKECGGTNVQIKAWVLPNESFKYVKDISNNCWCNDCQKHENISIE